MCAEGVEPRFFHVTRFTTVYLQKKKKKKKKTHLSWLTGLAFFIRSVFMGGRLFPKRSLAVQRLLRIGLLTCVVFLACSCTDTASVHEFARASQQVGAEFPPLAADGLASCHRASTFLLRPGRALLLTVCVRFWSIEPPLLAVQ